MPFGLSYGIFTKLISSVLKLPGMIYNIYSAFILDIQNLVIIVDGTEEPKESEGKVKNIYFSLNKIVTFLRTPPKVYDLKTIIG